MRLFKKIFFLFIALPMIVSGAEEKKSTESIRANTVVLERAASKAGLSVFEITGRVESYYDALQEKEPLGVYVLKEAETRNPIGIQSFTLYDSLDLNLEDNPPVTCVSEMTDILPSFQKKGYGTLLRNMTAKQLNPLIPKMFTYLYSQNEWCWGDNHASLISSLKAGYGILNFSFPMTGVVDMIYPADANTWSRKKTEQLVQVSKILQTVFMRMDHDKVLKEYRTIYDEIQNIIEPQEEEQVKQLLFSILQDLDLSKKTDRLSFLCITAFLLDHLRNCQDVKAKVIGFLGLSKGEEIEQIKGVLLLPQLEPFQCYKSKFAAISFPERCGSSQ